MFSLFYFVSFVYTTDLLPGFGHLELGCAAWYDILVIFCSGFPFLAGRWFCMVYWLGLVGDRLTASY